MLSCATHGAKRNEDAGATQAAKASKEIFGKQGKPKDTHIRRKQASEDKGSPLMKKASCSNGSQNIEEITHYNKEVYYGN